MTKFASAHYLTTADFKKVAITRSIKKAMREIRQKAGFEFKRGEIQKVAQALFLANKKSMAQGYVCVEFRIKARRNKTEPYIDIVMRADSDANLAPCQSYLM